LKQVCCVLGFTATLTTLHLIGFPNVKPNEAQAHCRTWHPHHCTIKEVVKDVKKTGDRWGLAAAHPVLIPVSGYLERLYQQGNGRWQSLPDNFKACYGRHYGINLDEVKYATNINTGHGSAITVGKDIYFPTDINLDIPEGKRWILHELEHVRQYQVTGGVSKFLVKYGAQGAMEIASNGSFKIHDNIQLEQEADAKADRILDSCSSSSETSIQRVHDEVIGGSGGPAYVGTAKKMLSDGKTLQDVRTFLVENFAEASIQRVHNEVIGGSGGPAYVGTAKKMLSDGKTLQDVRTFLIQNFKR
jgi:Domain of unknown function (DUF4157)